MYDVITVGSATVDCFVQTGNQLFRGKNGAVRVPFGSKLIVDDLTFCVGGGGTNTAVCLKRLGLKAAYFGKVGKGTNGERVMKLLRQEGVDTTLMAERGGRTGFSVVLDAYRHDRTILAFKGSNDDLAYSEAKLARMHTKWFYFSSMMGKSYKTTEKLALWAKKNNAKVMFNPSSYLCRKGKKFVARLVSNCEIIVLNKEEAELLTGKKDVLEMLTTLKAMGPEIAIITDGKNGAYVLEKAGYRIKARKVKVAETTGAGDAFGSSFLGAYIRTGDIKLSMKIGLVNAESVIQHVGSKNKLLGWDEALSKARKYPNKVQPI